MLEVAADYAKCAWKNPAVRWGYVGFGAGMLLASVARRLGADFLYIPAFSLFSAGSALLVSTSAGLGTYESYVRMREHILKFRTIRPAFRDSFSRLPCTQQGLRIAAEEHSLEELL
jgi:hypothetical protein